MRILLFTGKGGVGKTTVAAATAVRAAEAGLRTVVCSTDPAHSLADAFDAPLGDRPTPIAEHLWGQQLNARVRFEEAWADVRHYLVDGLDGVRDLLTDGDVTSARLVVNPERLVIAEARRTYTYLSMFGYHVDAVIANRVLPADVDHPWFAQWRATQASYLDVIAEAFAP